MERGDVIFYSLIGVAVAGAFFLSKKKKKHNHSGHSSFTGAQFIPGIPVTNTGYKKDSPDVNNPINLIPSSIITMENVEFPVMGIDNFGNMQVMQPGLTYAYQGDYVIEIPIRNNNEISYNMIL